MSNSRHIRINCTDEEYQYLIDNLNVEHRTRLLLRAADDYSGKTYDELTSNLLPKTRQALAIMPVFIGGDSSDIDAFVCDVWRRPVTEENMDQFKEMFRLWYSLVAPDEYHDPTPVHLPWGNR